MERLKIVGDISNAINVTFFIQLKDESRIVSYSQSTFSFVFKITFIKIQFYGHLPIVEFFFRTMRGQNDKDIEFQLKCTINGRIISLRLCEMK